MPTSPSKPRLCDVSPFIGFVNSVVTGELIGGEDPNGVAKAGEMFARTYNVTNEGTTTLSSLCITDEKFGATCLECAVSDDVKLPPGESFVCTAASVVSDSRLSGRKVVLVGYAVDSEYTDIRKTCDSSHPRPLFSPGLQYQLVRFSAHAKSINPARAPSPFAY